MSRLLSGGVSVSIRAPLLSMLFLPALAALAACTHRAHDRWQGYVEGEFTYVSSSQPGRLSQLSVSRGERVAAGAPLFALEAVDEAAALRQAQQQLAAARAQLADIQTGKRRPEIEVTQAQLAQATANASKARLQLARDAAQYRVGGIAKGQLEDSRAAADAAAAQVRELTHEVEVERLPKRTQQIAAQAAQVEAAQAAVAQAQWRLDEKRVLAPVSGLVYDTLYRTGEWVQAGNPVVQMLAPQNVKVRFFVPETLVGALRPGRALTIHCDGCATDVAATISYVAASAEYTPPVIYSNENRAKLVFLIEAHPSVADAVKLHPGQPVAVTLR